MLFTFMAGAMLLNSCHPIDPALKKEPMSVRIDGLRLYAEGPNCWNGALLKSGLIRAVRFVPKGEYWFWMNSAYCRKLGPSEKPKKGDLGSLFWPGQGHYHSFVYMDEDWVFSKNSPDPKYPYKVQAFDEMFNADYRATARGCWKEANGNYHSSANRSSKCVFDMKFHRCRAVEVDFYRNNKQLSRWDDQVRPLEDRVFSWVAGEAELTLEDYEETVLALNRLWQEVKRTQKQNSKKRLRFKLEAMEYRLLGLILADIKIGSLSPRLYPILQEAYRIQELKKQGVPK